MSSALLSAFARELRPAIVPLVRAGASNRAARALLIDGTAVLLHCAERAAPARGRAPRAHVSARQLHAELVLFLRALRDTGLDCVVFAAGAPHPREGGARLAALAAREGEEDDEAAAGHAALLAACADLGLETHACALAPQTAAATGVGFSAAILGWMAAHAETRPVFAVLSTSADYLVLGAERLAPVADVAACAGGATLHVWAATASWAALRKRWAPYERGAVGAETRAAVAVLLGSGYVRDGPRGPATRAPALAAGALLAAGGGEPSSAFFESALHLPPPARGPAQLGALKGALDAFARARALGAALAQPARAAAVAGAPPPWSVVGCAAAAASGARAPALALAGAGALVPRALVDACLVGLASTAGAGALGAAAADAAQLAPARAPALAAATAVLRAARAAAYARALGGGGNNKHVRPVYEYDAAAGGALVLLTPASEATRAALATAAFARAQRDGARAAGSLGASEDEALAADAGYIGAADAHVALADALWFVPAVDAPSLALRSYDAAALAPPPLLARADAALAAKGGDACGPAAAEWLAALTAALASVGAAVASAAAGRAAAHGVDAAATADGAVVARDVVVSHALLLAAACATSADAAAGSGWASAARALLLADDDGALPPTPPPPPSEAEAEAAAAAEEAALASRDDAAEAAMAAAAAAAIAAESSAASSAGGETHATDVSAAPTLVAASAASLLAAAAVSGGGVLMIDTGSSLSHEDWDEIDNKDVVSAAKGNPAFRLMQEIQPYEEGGAADSNDGGSAEREGALREPTSAVRAKLFDALFAARDGHAHKAVLKAVFAQEYAGARKDKAKKTSLDKAKRTDLHEAVKQAAGGGQDKLLLRWLGALDTARPAELLALRKYAAATGPGSFFWRAGEAAWRAAPESARRDAALGALTSANRAPLQGRPVRYPHQQLLIDLIDAQLTQVAHRADALPVQLVLSTPTGSGKTFTALMLGMQLLQVAHASCCLVYSVPTKQVLKAVGVQCEAHRLVYWTAAADASGAQFEVRRPYSIRTQKVKEQGGSGSSSLREQLDLAAKRGADHADRGRGRPAVLIADLWATAELLRVCSRPGAFGRASPFHPHNLVLYLDEPNMGVHLNARVQQAVAQIMTYAPATTVLASATLGSWGSLPAWWYGDGKPAIRTTISLPPYELPVASLCLLDTAADTLTPVSLLKLLKDWPELADAASARGGLRFALLLRHLTPAHAAELIGAAKPEDDADADGADGGDANANDDDDGDERGVATGGRLAAEWLGLPDSLRSAREAVEEALASLTAERFGALRARWEEPARKLTVTDLQTKTKRPGGLAGALSATGVTMVATLQPRALALVLAGSGDKAGWADKLRALKAKKSDLRAAIKLGAKELARSRKAEEGDGPEDAAGATETRLKLRQGLSVELDEADMVDDETLLMLQHGIAYASSVGTETLVARLYTQTLLHAPERAFAAKLPPIHTVCVDYSSVYGTDSVAVDTIVMTDELGSRLSWEDHQQFLGRLRRDGKAIYLSMRTMRLAALGARPPSAVAITAKIRATMAPALDAATPSAKQLACCRDALAAGINEGMQTDDTIIAALQTVLNTNLVAQLKDKTRVAALSSLLDACKERGVKAARFQGLLLDVAERIVSLDDSSLAPRLSKLFERLYDASLLEEPAALAWAQREFGGNAATHPELKAAHVAARKGAAAFIAWLNEADEESD